MSARSRYWLVAVVLLLLVWCPSCGAYVEMLLHARRDSAELNAVARLGEIAKAEQTYRERDERHEYGSLAALSSASLLVAPISSTGYLQWYHFEAAPASDPGKGFVATAAPVAVAPGSDVALDGARSFAVSEQGSVRETTALIASGTAASGALPVDLRPYSPRERSQIASRIAI